MKDFDYSRLPFKEIVRKYRGGASWRELAREYGCPDHKTLKTHVTQRYPELQTRDQAESQRARREREGTSRRKGGRKTSWWSS